MSEYKEKLGKGKHKIWIGLVVVLVIVLTLHLRGNKPGTKLHEPAEQSISVKTVMVESTSLPDEVTASGTVRPIVEAKIAPKLMSNVTAVTVREGDRVHAGQVLIRLESRDLAAQVQQAQAAVFVAQAGSARAFTAVDLQKEQTSSGVAGAEAALKAAREQLSIAKEGTRKQQKAQAHLAVVQADAELKNAQLNRDRMKSLFDQDVIPKQQLDQSQTAYEVAKAQYESTKEQANLADEGSRIQDIRTAQEQVRQAEAALRLAKASGFQNKMSVRNAQAAASQVAQARAALQYARVQSDYAVITSPISGVVTARMVDPGDTVSPGIPLISVEDDSTRRLEATIAAKDVQYLYIGKSVTVNTGSEGSDEQGKVSVISPSGDPGTRKFLVKVDLPKSSRAKSGDFGRLKFAQSYSKGIILPERAVRNDGGLTSVFIIGERNEAVIRVVKLGRKLNGGVEVVSGLQPGDRVIVENTGLLVEGAHVRSGGI